MPLHSASVTMEDARAAEGGSAVSVVGTGVELGARPAILKDGIVELRKVVVSMARVFGALLGMRDA